MKKELRLSFRFVKPLLLMSLIAALLFAAKPAGMQPVYAFAGGADGQVVSKEPILTVRDVLPGAGVDAFDSTSRLTLQIGDSSETITLEGPTTVNRSDPARDPSG
jgi:hypothetical protein